MKKKITLALLALVCALCCAFGLAACGGGDDNNNPPPVTPKTAQATVKVSYDFERDDYITGYYSFSFGNWGYGGAGEIIDGAVVFNVEPDETTNFDDATLKITFKRGYDLETLSVTEKDGKPLTREYETQYDNILVIKMPFDENLDYSLTLTAPDAIYETVGFEVDEQSGLEDIPSGAYLNLLTNTQVYVNDNEGSAGFVSLTREDTVNQNDRIFNIGQTSIEADMSKTYYAVYVRFDSSNPAKVIYDGNYEKLFTFGGNAARSVEYVKIPETNEYAYAFKFYTSDISETNSRLKLNTQYLKNIGNREDSITKNFSVITYKEEYGFQYSYKFELISYQIDSGEFKTDNLNNLKKEYGKAYTLKYQFKDIEVKGSDNNADKDALKETLMDNTDFSKIKLTVNGEKLTNLYFDEAEKVYSFTIGATKLPYDYNEDLGNAFTVNADKTTITAISSSKVYNLTVSKQVDCFLYSTDGCTVFNQYETENEIKYICIIEDKDYNVNGGIYLKEFTKFNLKITLNGAVRYTKTYTSGVDYFKSVTDKTGYEAFGNANISENFVYSQEYVFGDYDNSYISLEMHEGRLRIEINDKGNTSSGTDIKIELSEVEKRYITFDAKGELYGGSFTIDGEEKTTVEVNKEFEAVLTLSDLPRDSYDYFDYKYELYSNGVHIATTSYGSNESMIEGYETYNLDVMSGGSYGFSDTIDMRSKVSGVYVIFKPDTEDQTGDSDEVTVLIDKVVLNVYPTHNN